MSEMYVMVGIPASGKSTYIAEHMGENDICISHDKIRFAMVREDEDYFAKEKEVYSAFIAAIDKALEGNYAHVWVDATHISKASRAKLLRRLHVHPTKTVAIVMNTDFNTCRSRNIGREGRACVPSSAMNKMHYDFEEPNLEEGFDDIITIQYHHEAI